MCSVCGLRVQRGGTRLHECAVGLQAVVHKLCLLRGQPRHRLATAAIIAATAAASTAAVATIIAATAAASTAAVATAGAAAAVTATAITAAAAPRF